MIFLAVCYVVAIKNFNQSQYVYRQYQAQKKFKALKKHSLSNKTNKTNELKITRISFDRKHQPAINRPGFIQNWYYKNGLQMQSIAANSLWNIHFLKKEEQINKLKSLCKTFKKPTDVAGYLNKKISYQQDFIDDIQQPWVTYTKGKGDCADYAVFAEYCLEQMGYDCQTVALYNKTFGGHAICAFTTDSDGYNWAYIDTNGYHDGFHSLVYMLEQVMPPIDDAGNSTMYSFYDADVNYKASFYIDSSNKEANSPGKIDLNISAPVFSKTADPDMFN